MDNMAGLVPGVAKIIAEKNVEKGSTNAAQNVKEKEFFDIHFGEAGDKRDDRAQGADEAGERDTFVAVTLKKGFAFFEMRQFEQFVFGFK